MGQQQQETNPQEWDWEELSGADIVPPTEVNENDVLPDSAMGTGNDDPIDNWATPPASGSTNAVSGSTVTSGNHDKTDEIGAPVDVDDSPPGNEEGYNRDEPHHHGADSRATTMAEGPRNSQ